MPRDDWTMSLLADQGAYRGEDYPWDELQPQAPTRITVRPADSMYPRQPSPPDPIVPPPENPAREIPKALLPNLSDPSTYGPRPQPTMQANDQGKIPTSDPRIMGGVADIGNALYNVVPTPGAAAAPVGKAMLLGGGALGANKAAFKMAREMSLAGKTPSEIRRATLNDYGQGLFQLADQQWRFPISDKYSRMRQNAPMADFSNPHQLRDFFEHPEWYAQVPVMATMRTQAMSPAMVQLLGGLQGGYLPTRGVKSPPSILINPAAKTDPREVFLHEGTHGNQQIFDFAKGGGPEEVVPGTNAWNMYQDFIKTQTSAPLTAKQDAKVRAWASYQSYLQKAGEDEARRVQALRDASLKELNAMPIRRFHEYPFADQIVTPREYPPSKWGKPALAGGAVMGGLMAAMPDGAEAAPVPTAAPRMGALAKPFYSAVEQAVTAQRPTVMSAEQWMGTLRNTPGVKPEELQRLGVEKWLREQPGAVPKQALADYVAANKVGIEETRKGYPSNQPAKFGEYQLPGGENYRETLLMAPRLDVPPTPEEINRLAKIRYDAYGPLGGPSWERAPQNVRQDYLTEAERKIFNAENPGAFRGSHWDEPNVLAHYRTNDRTIGGKKTLFLEEVQSDWHQAGRKEGYHDDPKLPPEQLMALEEERTNLSNELDRLDRLSFTTSGEQRAAVLQQLDAKLARLSEIDPIMTRNDPTAGVPDAPFRTSWPELTMKRAIRDAAEGGYDQIAWTPGKVQADRYTGADGNIEEGMKAFYDKMLPNAANKVGKKHGAEVGQATMYEAGDTAGLRPFGLSGDVPKAHTVHTLPITPQLREQALRKGFPLFVTGGAMSMGALAAQDRYANQ